MRERKIKSRNVRILQYVIGASVIAVALMAFSGICWCTFGLCGSWFSFATVIEFWEIFGASAIALVSVMFIRSFSAKASSSKSTASVPSYTPVSEPDSRVPDSPDDCVESAAPQQSWRELCGQLSNEERENLKSIMKRYCDNDELPPGDEPTPDTSADTPFS